MSSMRALSRLLVLAAVAGLAAAVPVAADGDGEEPQSAPEEPAPEEPSPEEPTPEEPAPEEPAPEEPAPEEPAPEEPGGDEPTVDETPSEEQNTTLAVAQQCQACDTGGSPTEGGGGVPGRRCEVISYTGGGIRPSVNPVLGLYTVNLYCLVSTLGATADDARSVLPRIPTPP